MKKTGLLMLSGALLVAGLTSCGGNKSTITTINFKHREGTGTKENPTWIKQAAQRFEALHAEDSFEAGKKGVKINVTNGDINYDSLASEGFDIFLDETDFDAYKYRANMLDLSDVMNPIKSKFDAEALKRSYVPGAEGCYGLPHFQWFPGVTYDIDYFNEINAWYADPSVAAPNEFSSKYSSTGSFKFVASSSDKKSVGPDGVADTSDDGLPSSLEELCGLCDYIKSKDGNPFNLCGSGSAYGWYLVMGLWASLSGTEEINTLFCKYSDKEIEVVTDIPDNGDDLFYSGSGIKAPTTEKVVINDANGYKMRDMANRYYAISFLKLAYNEGWFSEDFVGKKNNPNQSANAAQKLFVTSPSGNDRYGMLYDASYWYHEDKTDIDAYQKTHEKRNVAFMPLPTTFKGQVEAGGGHKNVIIDAGSAYIFANKRVASNEGKSKAVKDFLSFLYSDSELAAFTELTGLPIPMEYSYDTSNLDTYYKEFQKFNKEADTVFMSSEDSRFVKNYNSFSLGFSSTLYPNDGYITRLQRGEDAKSLFNEFKLTEANWNAMEK